MRVSLAPGLWPFSAFGRPATWGRLQPSPEGPPGFSPTFFGFIYIQGAVLKPEKLLAYRKRRPERPPAGKIACRTKPRGEWGQPGSYWSGPRVACASKRCLSFLFTSGHSVSSTLKITLSRRCPSPVMM